MVSQGQTLRLLAGGRLCVASQTVAREHILRPDGDPGAARARYIRWKRCWTLDYPWHIARLDEGPTKQETEEE